MAAALAASAALAVEGARCTLTWATQRPQPPRPSSWVLRLTRHTLRDLRWAWQQRMAASAETTANATHAIVNEKNSASRSREIITLLSFDEQGEEQE